MVGCSCAGCLSSNPKDKRTRASILLNYNGKNVLVDTSTDLRQQILREDIKRIDAVLYTHSHADHVNGIDDLRGFHFLYKNVIPCYGSKETISVLERGFGYIFKEYDNSGYPPLMEPYIIDGDFDLFGLNIQPIELNHGRGFATGFRFGDCAYLTDCSQIPQKSVEKLKNLDLLIVDGLRWESHPSHFNIETAIEATKELDVKRTVLTHLTHHVLQDEEIRLPEGYKFGYDGMKLECSAGVMYA